MAILVGTILQELKDTSFATSLCLPPIRVELDKVCLPCFRLSMSGQKFYWLSQTKKSKINSFFIKMALIKEDMGLGSKMELGLTRARDNFDPKHPIEVSEKNFRQNIEKAFKDQCRMSQGFAAPLKLQIEQSAAAKVGHLPCITQRSNFQVRSYR